MNKKVMKMIGGTLSVCTCMCQTPGILITILIDIKMTFSWIISFPFHQIRQQVFFLYSIHHPAYNNKFLLAQVSQNNYILIRFTAFQVLERVGNLVHVFHTACIHCIQRLIKTSKEKSWIMIFKSDTSTSKIKEKLLFPI